MEKKRTTLTKRQQEIYDFLKDRIQNRGYGPTVREIGDNFGIKYTDASGVQVSSTVESTGFIDQTADTMTNAIPAQDAIVAASGCVNQALVLDNLGSNFAAGNSEMFVQVRYRVVTAGL